MEQQREFMIKNMVCSRCIKVIKQELDNLNVTILFIELGKLIVKIDDQDSVIEKKIIEILFSNGFEIAQSEENILVEKVKLILIDQFNELPINMRVKTSEYLSSALHRDYQKLSKLFSKSQETTIEKYFIKLKIEKSKELIQLKQYTFSDIAYSLDYSSVNHLSRQFKELVGVSMTDYKHTGSWERNFIDEII